MISVYVIFNTLNGKVYVGLSKSPRRRWRGHVYEARIGSPRLLCHAIRKHGVGAFEFSVLQWLPSKASAMEAERYWISYFQSSRPEMGYNQTEGGEAGANLTLEIRQRLRSAIDKRRQRSKAMLDALSKSRMSRCLSSTAFHAGSNNPMAILNEDDVLIIREWAKTGVMYADLAEHFGVRWGTIKAIVRRETWRHL